MSQNATSAWLAQAVGNKYHSSDVVRMHVEAALAVFSGLRPKTDNFTFDSGETMALLAVHGTLPVSFRGVVYNIPVAVWLPLTYPRHPPLAFVTPTANMLVRAGRHVDLAGRVYHPLLANWHSMSPQDVSLTSLLVALQTVFAVEPPVYAKPVIPQQQQQSHTSGTRTPPPVPINPLTLRQSTASPQPGSQYSHSPPVIPQKSGVLGSTGGGAPVIPPKPNLSSLPNTPPQSISPPPIPPNPLIQQQQQQRTGSGPVYVSFSQSTPVIPAKTLSNNQQPPTVPAPPVGASRPINIQHQYSSQYQQPIPINAIGSATFLATSPVVSPGFQQYNHFPNQQQQQQYNQQQQQQLQPMHYHSSPQQGYDPALYQQQQPQQQYYQQQQQPILQSNQLTTSSLSQQLPQQSPHLITPVALSNPPSTTSPTKPTPQQLETQKREQRAQELRVLLAGRLVTAFQDVEVSMLQNFERMRELGVGVFEGEARARGVLGRLGEEENKVRKNIDILGSKVSEMKAVIEKVKGESEVQVDEILTSVSVVENQLVVLVLLEAYFFVYRLLDLLAEEHALDDMIYQLTKALNVEKIELTVFMKHTRMLARDLFLKRALIKKIQLHIQMQ
ncbi:UNVERIFIED_CONTAM: hypothetical protein HDU68_009171 [Siphonaria sp. JEL0065]|nr:hypothetical protein HDU68_009171 [Siphonaria sp. JEL0065]